MSNQDDCSTFEMVRPAGVAPASQPWQSSVLLLNDGRVFEMALPRGLAPRASAFARQCAALLHLGSMESAIGPIALPLEMDARPGLAPGRSGLQSDGSSPLPCAQLNWGDQGDLHPPPRLSQSRMLTVTLRSPLKMDPPAGAAPAWSALRGRRIADLCHGGI